MELINDPSLKVPLSSRKILLIGGPRETQKFSLDFHEVFHTKSLDESLETISQNRPDLVIFFNKEREIPMEEHVMTWLIEGFRGKFIVFDPFNRIKDSEILLESQVLDDYFCGPVSPARFASIVKSQLTQDLRFANPRAMTTFDLFRNLFDRGLNALFFFNENMDQCVAANLRAERMTGHSLRELRNLGLKDIIHPEHLENTSRIIRRATRQYYDSKGISVLRNGSHEDRIVAFSCGVFRFGRKSFVKLEVQDRPEESLKENQTLSQVENPLKGLIREEIFLDIVDRNLSFPKTKRPPLTLIQCRISAGKNLEQIKDLEHEENQFLSHLVLEIKNKIRSSDTLARLGHYQFAILLFNTPAPKAKKFIERLKRSLQGLPQIQKGYFDLALGMAEFPEAAYPFMQFLHGDRTQNVPALPSPALQPPLH